uniref:Uncharacterized protein n=1 Tax=Anguilla anguilla TaxID=7936 RepID=A0A0E9W094_ANGAN
MPSSFCSLYLLTTDGSSW